MGTTTATVLFCDVADSTPHRAQLGEAEADRYFRALERRFRDCVEAAGGRVLKGGGDGIMALFGSASEALGGAIALQRSTAADRAGVLLRIGVAAGDVTYENDDCFGMPVVVAARLERACEPGGIVVSSVVRALSGDRVRAEFEPLGPLDLKGVPEPVESFAVDWRVVDDTPAGWSFPSVLPRRDEYPCVGRQAELRTLHSCWADSRTGDQALVLLSGEAGVGKTRLATEQARRCHGEGALVLAGLCDRELSLPYQPWVMVIEQLVAQLPSERIEDLRGSLAALQVLVPHLDDLLGGLARIDRLDPEAERLRMFTAAATVLAVATELAPVLVIIDDLHWAGKQTLDLLRFLTATHPVERCLIVATHRDTTADVGDALRATVADFRRMANTTEIKVDGMAVAAVRELLDEREVEGDRDARAVEIAGRTHGNALLVTALLRDDARVPSGVVDVVGGRLEQLGTDARALADLIAIAGRIDLRVLGEVARPRGIDLEAGLAELVGFGLVQEFAAAVPAYQFAHALIRDAVRSEIAAFRAVSLHHQVAHALEQVHVADRRPVLAELAVHFAAAATEAGWRKAAYYGRRAAAQARRTAAYVEAIELIDTALGVAPAGTVERAELLLDAVDLMERCGRNPEAVELAEEAEEIAADIGDRALQAQASIDLERAAHLANASLERSVPRLRRVLQQGEHLPLATRIRVTASLGRACWLNGMSEGPSLANAALDAARELDDEATLCHALEANCVLVRDPRLALAHARELEHITVVRGDVFQSMWAMTRQTDALVTLGMLAEAELVLDRLRDLAEKFRFTNYRFLAHLFAHTLALAAGDFDMAEAATEAADTTERSEFGGVDADGAYGLQMFMIRRAQARLEEMRPALELIARAGTHGIWRPGLVLAFAEIGMVEEAEREFDDLMATGWHELPRDALWPLTLLFLAETCVILERNDVAPILFDEFEPLAGLTIRAGYTTNGGPADRCRAALAEVAGHHAVADDCIAAAHELASSSGAALWLAQVESTWAQMLAGRGDAAARKHHERATELAERLGLGGVPAVLSLGVPAPDSHGRVDQLTEREVEVLTELAKGSTNRQIADRLYISVNTVANHVRSILRKTGCANRTEAAAYALGQAAEAPRRREVVDR